VTEQNTDLLQGLIGLGCHVENVDAVNLISLPDGFGDFMMDWQGAMLYIGTTLMAPEEFVDSAHEARLYRFLLELQDRSLGCHFACDRSGFLCIGSELFPEQQDAQLVFQAMEQIAYVVEVCILMCDRILENGEIPADEEVDRAFGISKNLH